MKRIVVVEGSTSAGQMHLKLQITNTTTFGDVKKMVSARLEGEALFYPNCHLGDADVFVGDRLDVTDVDPMAQKRFEQFYEAEREKWSTAKCDLLQNRETLK